MRLSALAKPFTMLAGHIDHSVEQQVIMSLLRHVATALGAILVTHGYLDMSHTAEFIGALLTLVGTLSGSAQKTQG